MSRPAFFIGAAQAPVRSILQLPAFSFEKGIPNRYYIYDGA
jgi:hypothetical protein